MAPNAHLWSSIGMESRKKLRMEAPAETAER
jgi:hypothetical protein